MTLFDSFDSDRKAVLNPEDFIEKAADFPETVVVTFKQQILDIMLDTCDCEKIAELDLGSDIPLYRLEYGEKPLAFYKTVMGAAGAVALMEEAIALGGKNFVFFGSCGTLSGSGFEVGSFVVPTAAYRDEGTSYHYLEAADYIEIETAGQTAEILRELGLDFTETKTWTTDGLYRETVRNMRGRIAEGCGVVDMECSAFMAVAKFRGVRAYQYLYTEDHLDEIRWEPRTLGRVPRSASELYLKAALEIAARV